MIFLKSHNGLYSIFYCLFLSFCLFFFSCQSNRNISENDNLSPLRKKIIEEAESWIGTPYCYGGESQECTDCSGFVMKVFMDIGIELPRTALEQYYYGNTVDLEELKPGDLLFFRSKSKVSHVAIYAGKNQYIHASSSKGVIKQSLGDNYFKKSFFGCKTILEKK